MAIKIKNGKRLLKFWMLKIDRSRRQKISHLLSYIESVCMELDDVWNGCYTNFDSVFDKNRNTVKNLSRDCGFSEPSFFIRRKNGENYACFLPFKDKSCGILVMDGKTRMFELCR